MKKEEVEKLAELSRLEMTTDEIMDFSQQMTDILSYVDQLKEVEVSGIEPTSQVTGLLNVLRNDTDSRQWDKEKLLSQTPETQDGYVKVPGVFDQQEE